MMALATPEQMNGGQVMLSQPRTNQIPLSRLIDFAVQRTYHELQVLTDLLTSKSDRDRKIEIANFANRTRQTFIRLLALVKWAGSASKVEKCSLIGTFLERQSELFTLTADSLAKMARESLVQARLPGFHIPAAVEVLTLGTYSRLPTCIREKIVPPDPITSSERKATLLRLNQIIQQRLVVSTLPTQMRNLKIENGRVTFHVNHEFKLCLTLMSDSQLIPWRVLSVEILVSDRETGDGRDLVHPMQIVWLQDFIQSKLVENNRPLLEAYNVLHSFCLSLQLEVLYAQTVRLIRERLFELIRIDDYQLGRRLSIQYWRDFPGMKFLIEIDPNDSVKPLLVRHFPELGEKESITVNDAIKSDRLSVEKLFIHTTHERAKYKLIQLQKQLSELKVGGLTLSGVPSVLELSFLSPCLGAERLLISVDTLTGSFVAHIPQFEDCALVEKFPAMVKDPSKIKPWIHELQIWMVKQRCKKTVELLPVQVYDDLPFVNSNSQFDAILSANPFKLFFQFSRHNSFYLMVTFSCQSPETGNNVSLNYHLISVEKLAFDGSSERNNNFESDLPKEFLRVATIVKLDTSGMVKRSSNFNHSNLAHGKRKNSPEFEDGSNKKQKNCGFFISELSYLISFCEEKLAFGSLSSELHDRGICHQVRVGIEPSYAHMIDIVKLPSPRSLKDSPSKLQEDLLNSTIRLQGKEKNKIWTVTLCFCNCPVTTLSSKENGSRKTVYLMYDFANGSKAHVHQMVSEFLEDWAAIDKLYQVVYDFGKVAPSFSSIIDIKYFTYKKLLISYGPDKGYSIAIHWKALEKRFHLSFGVTGTAATNSNPHVIVSTQLQNEFNQHKSIATLVQTLTTTFSPLSSLLNLSSIPSLALMPTRPQIPLLTCCLLPQTSSHVRLIYRSIHCVDIVVQSDGLIAVRDGAFCSFDKSKLMEELQPINGFKNFISKFVDKGLIQRRLSQADDSCEPNTPGPAGDSTIDQYLFNAGQVKTSSPSVPDSSHSATMRNLHHGVGLGSNPNTPSSPRTSMMSQMGYGASPGNSFSMTASPSHQMPAPSPSIPSNLPDRSPAGMFSVNSPASHQSPGFLPTPSPGPSVSANMQSPASHFMPSSVHDHSQVNSPFHPSTSMNIHSPATGGWPGSPSIPRPSPSRPLSNVQSPGSCGQPMNIGQSPQTPNPGPSMSYVNAPRSVPLRSWAASIPTILTPQGFEAMCKPTALPAPYSGLCVSPLDRFLGKFHAEAHP